MSTNCLIGKAYGDRVKAIYCHHDGYPSHVGNLLEEYYNNDNIIDKLIQLGDISSLYENLEPKSEEQHSLEHPAPNTTVAYHRDSNEDLCIRDYHISDFISEKKFYKYIYLWKDNEWLMFSSNENDY